ncbi:MAG: efflux RND transporter periplasmic adaptor subunit [Stappiaceae bacterium]
MAIWKQLLLCVGLICFSAVGLALFAPGSRLLNALPFGEALSSLGSAQAKYSDQRAGSGGGKPGLRRARPLPLVVLSKVEPALADERVKSVGTAQAIQRTTLFPEVAGRVISVDANAGQRLSVDDIVVQLDDQVQRLAVERASLSLADAEDLVQRYQTLAAKNTISAVQLTDAKSAMEKAKLDLKGAEDALNRRSVRAPFSGEIGLIDVGVGDYVTPTTAVGSLDERKTLLIEFRLPERFSNHVRVGQAIDLQTAALPGIRLVGVISGIDNRIDTVSRTILLQGEMNNETDLARPGMSFDVSLEIGGEEHPSVPSLAVQWDRQGPYVWKVDGDRTTRADIGIIARLSDRVLISGDLAVGESVVSEGTAAVRQGMVFRTPEG